MPYFQGQAVGDDYLQGELARYRAQNPGAAADDQSILNVLEGRGQPTWETRGQFGMQAPPPQAPGYGLPPGAQTGFGAMGGAIGGAGMGGMTPLSSVGRGQRGGLFGGLFGALPFGGGPKLGGFNPMYQGGGGGGPWQPKLGGFNPMYQQTPTVGINPAGSAPQGGLDQWGRVPFDPTYGAPPPPGGFPGYQLMGQPGQMTPLSQMGYPGLRY